jgi:hypothetical protein
MIHWNFNEADVLREVLVEPAGDPKKGDRESIFKMLFGLGTAILFFGVLLSQTKGADRAPDLVIFLTAAVLLIAALLLGQRPRRPSEAEPEWRSGPISTVILLFELVAALCALTEVVLYELQKH